MVKGSLASSPAGADRACSTDAHPEDPTLAARDNLDPEGDNEGVDMNDPQIWTLIGVFAAAILGGFTVVITSLSRVIRAEVGGLRAEIGGLRGEVGSEIGGLRGEVGSEIGGLRSEVGAQIGGLRAEMLGEIGGLRGEIGGLRGEVAGLHARFDGLEKRMDHLDRDVQAITDRLWRGDRGA
ncbi:hypothetical protein GCM10017607_31450 [Microbacterium thalassium]|nr:hypothetical protein GCM10017607_31450 [Microbacterium thalassium]